ncbi:hypothetical protein VNI00_016595 [Paramarasmius palmivorus]|uniref:Uncharacterized protein n=1 Tax=Paramarasmius palmivorus TaxID=297713 RepID=A0AAW0BEX9_9AGAR
MGGFALYDGDEFCGYLWNDRCILPNTSQQALRVKIQNHHEVVQAATMEIDEYGQRNITGEAEDSCSESDSDETCSMRKEASVKKPVTLLDNAKFLKYLIENGYIPITEDEITDNISHSNSITKIIAVIQTAWFLLQVGARAMEGLAITELEIITVGFAVLNFGTYFLWWNKPVRVKHPVRVYWRQQRVIRKKDNKDGAQDQISKIRKIVAGIWDLVRDAAIKFGTSMIVIFNFLKDPLNSDHDDSKLNDKSIPGPNWRTLLQLVGLPYSVVVRLIGASICIILDNIDTAEYMASVVGSSRLEDDPLTVYIVVYGLTTLFGAIHCIPWSFEFSTRTERLLWRISASGLVILPLTLLVVIAMGKLIASIDDIFRSRIDKGSWAFGIMQGISVVCIGLPAFVIGVTLPFAYIVARVNLLSLALMELRILPQSAYQTVEWTTFIPHIG